MRTSLQSFATIGLLIALAACGAKETEAPSEGGEHHADHHAEQPAAAAQPAAEAQPAGAVARDDANWKYFGAPFSVGEPLAASAVLAEPDRFAGKPVRFRGELTEVCQKAGCWAVVRDDAGNAMRITMKDHSFGIDKDTKGKACDIEGELVKKAVDPERIAHFESEGAKENPEAGKTEAWEIVASAVAVSRS